MIQVSERASSAPSLFVPVPARIAAIETQTPREKLFRLELPGGRDLGHQPGQFVEVSLFGYGEAPISVSSSPVLTGAFEICLRRVGDVTGALHRLSVGDTVGIRGPLGIGFPLEEMKGQDVVFVAGGLGLIPLRSLIRTVLHYRDDFGRVIILYGTRTPEEILFRNELERWAERDDVQLLVTVDKPAPDWRGNVGVITTLFPKISLHPVRTVAAVVGPPVMYRFVLLELTMAGVKDSRVFLSLERRMKCGMGKCGHCQINGRYVCQEGPVFRYSELRPLKEAL